jgi:tetratricopeptide (TPR) repeat protein
MSKVKIGLAAVLLCGSVVFAHAQVQDRSSLTAEQYRQQGDQFARQREYDKAIDAYRRAIELNPDLAAAYHGLGTTYFNMGRVVDSLEPLKTTVKLEPNNAIAHLNLGTTLAALRRPDEALAEMNEAKRINPKSGRIQNDVGNFLANIGRLDDALNAYTEARKLSPDVPAVHHNIGLVFMRMGKFADAVAPLEEALRLNPRYSDARYMLSDAYTYTSQFEKAVQSWSKFLELVPNGPEALIKQTWDYLYWGGHGEQAAANAVKFLEVQGWRHDRASYMVILAYLGYKEAAMISEAEGILADGEKNCRTDLWPYPVIRALKGELSAEEIQALGSSNDKKTEIRTYLGMDLLLKGDKDAAKEQFQWVKDYGNKRFVEYVLSVERLKSFSASH